MSGWGRITVFGATIVAVGITLGGWFIGHGFTTARVGDRIVSVKGVAEREAKADLALWPIQFVTTSNQLEKAQSQLAENASAVIAFVTGGGIPKDAIEIQSVEVTDLLAQAYRSGPVESRFIVNQTLMVRTNEVDKIKALSQRIGELIAAGVVLSTDNQPMQGPYYLFTRLNDIKPAMIAEATNAARDAADQFAKDSASRIAGIQRASQGVFQILPRDDAPGIFEQKQIFKTVRVVSTIDYSLED